MTVRECDFLIVGGGIGGLAAAARATALGLDAVILEKSDYLGGVAAYSGGIVWVGNNHLAARDGFPDDADRTGEYVQFLNGDDPNYDHALRDTLMQKSIEAVEYYTETLKVPFSVIGRQDQYYPDAPGSVAAGRSLEVALSGSELGNKRPLLRPSPLFRVGLTRREINEKGGKYRAYKDLWDLYQQRVKEDYLTSGQGLAGGFLKAALVDQHAEFHINANVRKLLVEHGRVVGAEAVIDGEHQVFHARKGVLLAAGSYGYHKDVARMEGLPGLKEQAPPIIHGDGLRLADGTGAAVTRAGITFTTLGFASKTHNHPGSDEPLYLPIHASAGYPHAIIVNTAGDRFGDESFYGYLIYGMQAFDGRTKRFTNYPSFLVMDDRYRQRYSLAELDEWPVAELTRAETLDELAQALGIDAAGLAAQVSRFNSFVETGHDLDFQRGGKRFAATANGDAEYTKNPVLGAISQPPYWGVKLEIVGAGIYSMGLPINSDAQVLTRDGDPVPGLYASGNTAAYTEILHGYEGGIANIRGITYGYLAATHAASVAAA